MLFVCNSAIGRQNNTLNVSYYKNIVNSYRNIQYFKNHINNLNVFEFYLIYVSLLLT